MKTILKALQHLLVITILVAAANAQAYDVLSGGSSVGTLGVDPINGTADWRDPSGTTQFKGKLEPGSNNRYTGVVFGLPVTLIIESIGGGLLMWRLQTGNPPTVLGEGGLVPLG